MLVAASLMAMETDQHAREQQRYPRRQAVVVCRQSATAAAKGQQRQNAPPPSPKPPPPAGRLSAEAFLVLACVAVSLIVLPLVLPSLPPPPQLLLLVPVCLLLLLAALATFVPSDVRKRITDEEAALRTGMTDAVKEVAHNMTVPVHSEVHPDLYNSVMGIGGFEDEALMFALQHLLDNKAQGLCFVQMSDAHRVLWLRTFLAKHYDN